MTTSIKPADTVTAVKYNAFSKPQYLVADYRNVTVNTLTRHCKPDEREYWVERLMSLHYIVTKVETNQPEGEFGIAAERTIKITYEVYLPEDKSFFTRSEALKYAKAIFKESEKARETLWQKIDEMNF